MARWTSARLYPTRLLAATLAGQSQLEKILDERFSVTAEVESIYFNPFSFYFEIGQLSLIDPDQDALLTLGNLQLNFQASRLALLKLQFSEAGELVPLEILSLNLSNISTHIIDEVPTTPFSTSLSLIQAQIDDFSTLPDQAGRNILSINFEDDVRLTWNGDSR